VCDEPVASCFTDAEVAAKTADFAANTTLFLSSDQVCGSTAGSTVKIFFQVRYIRIHINNCRDDLGRRQKLQGIQR
jgi:hypothetical protein